MIKNRNYIIQLFLLLTDLLSLFVSLVSALFIRYGKFGNGQTDDTIQLILFVMLIYMALWVVINFNRNFFERGLLIEMTEVLKANVLLSLSLALVLFLIHRSSEFSRLVFGYFLIINSCLQFIFRISYKNFFLKVYKKSKSVSRMLLVTTEEQLAEILKKINVSSEWSRNIIGIVLKGPVSENIDLLKAKANLKIVTDFDHLTEYCIHNPVDEVFISLPYRKNLSSLIDDLQLMGIVVNVNIGEFDLAKYGNKTLSHVGHLATVTFSRNTYSTRQLILKRILDILGSLIGILIFIVSFIFIAPLIKISSPGPVIFSQTRIGLNGRKFKFFKYRSMYIDAEERKKSLMEKNEVQGLMFKMENDPRITPIGKFLRETSLDELPQFINVLVGDMSLVGTRPPTLDEYEKYDIYHKCRLSMKPGITGMWQVKGRSDIKNFDEVVKLDMLYIDNWNILKDIKIIFETVWVVLKRKGSR